MIKNREEILRRAVVLLSFSDRCSLEKNIINGKLYSSIEREMQRQAINNWLSRMEYNDYISKIEKQVFDTSVCDNLELIKFQYDYECIEPLLWCIGLVKKLSDYNEFVVKDFHPILEIGDNHSFSDIHKTLKLKSEKEIQEKRELAMLWYWRCLENNNNKIFKKNYAKIIHKTFNGKYDQLLSKYGCFDNAKGDFIVQGKTISQLNDTQFTKISIISEKRFYAFEWLCTEDEWDNVNLCC